MAAKFCLTFQREPLSVPVTRHVLGGILHSVGVDDNSVSDLLLAATEACSNVLRHGGPRVTGYAVLVTIGATRCEVEIAEDNSFSGSGGHDSPRRAVGAGRLPRPSPGLTLEGGRRRAGRTLRLAPRKVSWPGSAGSSPASGPARGDSAADRRRAAREPDGPSLAESGRGLDIMRACVDDLTLATRPGRGTVVTLRKRIGWAADAPLTRMRAAS